MGNCCLSLRCHRATWHTASERDGSPWHCHTLTHGSSLHAVLEPAKNTALVLKPCCCHPCQVVLAGLAQLPDSAYLHIIYASLQAVLLNDPSVGLDLLAWAVFVMLLSFDRFRQLVCVLHRCGGGAEAGGCGGAAGSVEIRC